MLEKHHGVRILDEAVEASVKLSAPLHPRPAAPRQVGQPARHRLRPGGDRPERHPRRPSRTAAARSTTSRSRSASSTARAPPAAGTTSGSPRRRAGARRRPRPGSPTLEDALGRRSRRSSAEIRDLRDKIEATHAGRRPRPATAAAGRRRRRSSDELDAKTTELRALAGRVPADAGLRRRPDRRRGRSPAGPASPSARCSPTRSRPS